MQPDSASSFTAVVPKALNSESQKRNENPFDALLPSRCIAAGRVCVESEEDSKEI